MYVTNTHTVTNKHMTNLKGGMLSGAHSGVEMVKLTMQKLRSLGGRGRSSGEWLEVQQHVRGERVEIAVCDGMK